MSTRTMRLRWSMLKDPEVVVDILAAIATGDPGRSHIVPVPADRCLASDEQARLCMALGYRHAYSGGGWYCSAPNVVLVEDRSIRTWTLKTPQEAARLDRRLFDVGEHLDACRFRRHGELPAGSLKVPGYRPEVTISRHDEETIKVRQFIEDTIRAAEDVEGLVGATARAWNGTDPDWTAITRLTEGRDRETRIMIAHYALAEHISEASLRQRYRKKSRNRGSRTIPSTV